MSPTGLLVGYSVMSGVDILMVSVLLENTVQCGEISNEVTINNIPAELYVYSPYAYIAAANAGKQ